MQNYALFDTETGLVCDYPRQDNQPAVGLDPRYEVLQIVREPAPTYDPASETRTETRTVNREAGEWRWGWAVAPLPPVPPQPDWRTFKRTLLAHPAINTMLGSSLSQAPAAGMVLPATLLETAAGSDVDDFRGAWVTLRRLGLVSSALVQEVRGMAITLHLPEPFIAALGGSARPAATGLGQEWIDAAGDLWVVVQARDENGQFVPDDPTTPERESLIWEQQL
jgi:hypothetical protein